MFIIHGNNDLCNMVYITLYKFATTNIAQRIIELQHRNTCRLITLTMTKNSNPAQTKCKKVAEIFLIL